MQLDATYKEKTSRGELLRIFWWFPLVAILYLWGALASIFILIHFVQILVQEKRDKSLHAQLTYFLKYQWEWTLYTFWISDVQPPWNPFQFIEACKAADKKTKA